MDDSLLWLFEWTTTKTTFHTDVCYDRKISVSCVQSLFICVLRTLYSRSVGWMVGNIAIFTQFAHMSVVKSSKKNQKINQTQISSSVLDVSFVLFFLVFWVECNLFEYVMNVNSCKYKRWTQNWIFLFGFSVEILKSIVN